MGGGWQMGWYNGWSPQERMAGLPVQREAIRSGVITKPRTCSICNTTPKSGSADYIWLHDENYADPLAAYHVCRSCHRTLHNRFDQPEPWLRLVEQHRQGGAWFELLTMDRASLRQPFDVTYPQGLPPASSGPPANRRPIDVHEAP